MIENEIPSAELLVDLPTDEYSDEAWNKIEAQRQKMRDARIVRRFDEAFQQASAVKATVADIVKTIGKQDEAHKRIVVIAAEKAGKKGVLLSDLRRLVPESNQLNEARAALLEPKDNEGKELPPVIEEKRGENNEVRIFLVKTSIRKTE